MYFCSLLSDKKHPLEQKDFAGFLLTVKLMKIWMLGFVTLILF